MIVGGKTCDDETSLEVLFSHCAVVIWRAVSVSERSEGKKCVNGFMVRCSVDRVKVVIGVR